MPIVWHDAQGSVLGVTTLVEGWLDANRLEGESTAEAVARLAPEIAKKFKPGHIGLDCPFTLVRSAQMPQDRSRRQHWRVDGDRVTDEETADG